MGLVFAPVLPLPPGSVPQYQAIGKVRVDPNNSNTVIVGAKTGVYFSYDAGLNWTGPCVTNAFPMQLSGGMQQRLQIARCLAQSPQVLLMDEPFGALDAMTRQTLQDEVARLSTESGTTVVFVTHDLEEAIYLGDRVMAMESHPGRIGEVVEIDLPRPRNQLTTREDARFLAYRHRLFNLLPTGH